MPPDDEGSRPGWAVAVEQLPPAFRALDEIYTLAVEAEQATYANPIEPVAIGRALVKIISRAKWRKLPEWSDRYPEYAPSGAAKPNDMVSEGVITADTLSMKIAATAATERHQSGFVTSSFSNVNSPPSGSNPVPGGGPIPHEEGS